MEITEISFNFESRESQGSSETTLFSKQHFALYALYVIIGIFFIILVFNLINLQLVEGNDNLYLSSAIRTDETVIRASRGIIYDRNDVQLVSNVPSFRVAVDTSKLPVELEGELISSLSALLDTPEEEIAQTLEEELYVEGERTYGKVITISRSVNRDAVLSIYANIQDLPGVFVEVDSKREYLYKNEIAHIIGYVGEVSEEDMERNNVYAFGDSVGKDGLEYQYDSVLRGLNGKQLIERNRDNEEVRLLNPIPSEPGDNVRITIDIEVQQQLVEYLKKGMEKYEVPSAAGVLMDVETGEIVAMASLPSYDPNLLIEGISSQELNALFEDENLPFFNRSIASARPPGSTFKTITASAGLKYNFISPLTILHSEGCYELGGGFEFCEAGKVPWGDLDLIQGLTVSSNIYFCKTMLEQGMTIDELVAVATEEYGLSQPTGIDLPGEVGGSIATRELKEAIFQEQWYPGDSCNAAVGQGLTQVTPLQMASWIASIANGGHRVTPHIASQIIDNETNEITTIDYPEPVKINIADEHLASIRLGMHEVVNAQRGSAWHLRGSAADPAAKTGSAEVVREVDGIFVPAADAWVTGFFPYENPKYSFVIYMEYGGWGFEAADVMRGFLDWFAEDYNGLEKY